MSSPPLPSAGPKSAPCRPARGPSGGGRRALALGLGLAAVASVTRPPAALAQSDAAVAEELFRRGRQLMNQNKVAEACAKFTDSHRLDPKLGTLLNLAVCHEKEGKTASAWAEFVEASSQATRSGQAERSRFARGKAQELEKRLVRVELRVESPAAEQTVSLGSKPVPSSAWGVAIPVDPGTYTVTAAAPHKKEWSGELVVPDKPGTFPFTVPTLVGEPEPAAAPPPAAIATPAPPPARDEVEARGPGWRPAAAIAAGGLGLAGVAVGTIFGLRTLSKKADADEQCEGQYCSQAGLTLHDEARSASTLSTVGFVAGALGLGLGAYFWLSAGDDGGHGAPKGAAVRWSPGPGRPGPGMLHLEGTW
jgi:hypothetical protein